MRRTIRNNKGFTIVELLIVIVVIAILASITIVAFNGIQQRGRDTQRYSDIKAIEKALEVYKIDNGRYPEAASAGGLWERSDEDGPADFIAPLLTVTDKVPLDPLNNTDHVYKYYRYGTAYLATRGCPTDRGGLYILIISRLESETNPASTSPGFQCGDRDWGTEGAWVKGVFEK